jgi:hypothetical protein
VPAARWLLAVTALVLASACGGPSSNAQSASEARHQPSHHKGERHDWWHSRVTIENRSHWAIHQIFLTPFESTAWGDGQLGPSELIGTGQSLELRGIDCDTYDVKLVDEDGDECVIQDVDLCLEDAKWILNDKDLIACQRKTAARGTAR